jgi:hypothetical protein
MNAVTHGASELGIDSPNPHRIEIRSPALPKLDPPLKVNFATRNRLADRVDPQLTQEIMPHPDPIDVSLIPVSSANLDLVDFDFGIPQITAASSPFDFFDSLYLHTLDLSSARHSDIVPLPQDSTRIEAARNIPSDHNQQILPFRSHTYSSSNYYTSLTSCPTLRGVVCWKNPSLTLFWDSPGTEAS